jgi:hypothetical protein
MRQNLSMSQNLRSQFISEAGMQGPWCSPRELHWTPVLAASPVHAHRKRARIEAPAAELFPDHSDALVLDKELSKCVAAK